MTRTDPIQEGLQRGWRVTDGRTLEQNLHLEADVAIVGTGAGGGVAAHLLTQAGLKVVLLEEGPLRSSRDFKMREAEAYPDLYQESAARKTADKAINILQGRAVGGSTTVNWTSSFRTPADTLAHWRAVHGLSNLTEAALRPWFEQAETAFNVSTWAAAPNANNEALRTGARRLGIPVAEIKRNVKGCWNLGYCGMGCPVNAKQSMLVTTVPWALDRGAQLLHSVRVQSLTRQGHRIEGVQAFALDAKGLYPRPVSVTVKARHVVLAGGAINSPAVLLRSDVPDPHGVVGRRTFLHPTVVSAGLMPDPVRGDSGAPQTLYSDHFLHTHPITEQVGYKLESAPLHPTLFASTLQGVGAAHRELMGSFAHTQVLLALMRDGFVSDSPGGRVTLRADGTPVLDYPLTPAFWDAARRAFFTMAEIQFAAGAKQVLAVHEDAGLWNSWSQAKAGIAELPMKALRTRVVSAHVMGGCAMGGDERTSIADEFGRHRHVENLTIADGSLFPTSLGANPQLSIYGLVWRNVHRLAQQLVV